jgi:hypothetical protein
MAWSQVNGAGKRYFLHARRVTLRGGRTQTIYFFARQIRDGALDELPAGYVVVENQRTGLLVLKKAT